MNELLEIIQRLEKKRRNIGTWLDGEANKASTEEVHKAYTNVKKGLEEMETMEDQIIRLRTALTQYGVDAKRLEVELKDVIVTRSVSQKGTL